MKVWLKAGREKSLRRRHPWVFSGAVERVEGSPTAGETAELFSSLGEWLGRAAWSPHSQISARVWTWAQGEPVGAAFFRRRLEQAQAARAGYLPEEQAAGGAVRLVHAESDGLPGLVVDRYADGLVVQFLSAGPERWREEIVAALVEVFEPVWIYERSDVDVRRLEGLAERSGLLWGPALPERVEIVENGRTFRVDIEGGHKTGFYLDQRQNRQAINELAGGLEVLDCFCYTGGFTVCALAGEAKSVLAVDSSGEALAQAVENVRRNALDETLVEFWEQDVFKALRELRDRGRSFDLVVLDPPKFAATASQAEKAARGYKDINLLALKLLRPGGRLATFSCSGGVSAELFQKIVAGAALDARVEARIIGYFHQSPDHPVALSFPEGEYLKGLLVGVGGEKSNRD